jgi:hypothetical protein
VDLRSRSATRNGQGIAKNSIVLPESICGI